MAQQGINFHMPLQVEGAALADLDHIELIFKQVDSAAAPVLKQSLWAADGSGDAQTKEGSEDVILVPWTRAETYLFRRNTRFYLQARFHDPDTDDNPPSPTVELVMHPSLFGPDQEVSYD